MLGMSVRWRIVQMVVTCLLAGYATVLLMGTPFLGAEPPLGDFASFYLSGKAAASGLNPYEAYTLDIPRAVNLNAPASLLLFAPLAGVDPLSARRACFVFTVVAMALLVGLLALRFPGPPLRLAWAVAAAPFWETVALGQIYALLALPTTVAWLLVQRRPALSGALIGAVAAVKPNFLFWAALLFFIGCRRAAIIAAITTLGLCALAALVFGPNVYVQWFAVVGREPNGALALNAALGGLLTRLGVDQLAVPLDIVGLLAIAAAVVRFRPTTPALVNGLALTAMLVFSPLAWVGYGLFLLPLFFERPWTVTYSVAAALLLVPRVLAQEWADASALLRLSIGSAYSWAFLLLLSQQVRALSAPGAQAAPEPARLRGTPAPS